MSSSHSVKKLWSVSSMFENNHDLINQDTYIVWELWASIKLAWFQAHFAEFVTNFESRSHYYIHRTVLELQFSCLYILTTGIAGSCYIPSLICFPILFITTP